MTTVAAVAAGLGSAVTFGLASAGQHRVAAAGESAAALDPRLLVRLARSPAWLLAGVLELLAVGLQLLALRWGEVSLVQPLLVLGLPVAVLTAALVQGQRVSAREWLGVALCAAGVGVVAAVLPGEGGRVDTTSNGTLAVLVTVLVLAATSALGGSRAPALVGAGAGVAAGVGAAALALCGDLAADPARLLTDWPPYLALAGGLLALQLGQAAFQHHRLGAPLAAATLAEPVTAVALAALVLHEQLTGSAAAQLLSAAAVSCGAVGVLLLVSEQARTT